MTAPRAGGEYPGKPKLSRADRMNVLKFGADPAWFEPWITRGVLLPGAPEHKSMYGYIHVHGGTDEPFQYDVCMFRDRSGLSWGLERLHKGHSECEECQGLFYFTPDEPLHMRMVVEVDPEDDGSAEPEVTA